MTEIPAIKQSILSQLPQKWQKKLEKADFCGLEEIRFRVFLPTMLYYSDGRRKILENSENLTTYEDLELILAAVCNNSVYAHSADIANGFVTLSGGHRAGLSGRGVKNGNTHCGLTQISGINIRISKQIKACADGVFPFIRTKSGVKNTVIISPPAAGKTTMLREIARKLSHNFKVCVIDERSEIAAISTNGRGYDLGPQTDVLDAVPKNLGITMALRTLSPEIIITDEIDTESDLLAIKNIIGAGAKVITSAHSDDFNSFKNKNGDFLKLFDTLIVLSRKNGAGTVEEVFFLDDLHG